MSGLAGQTAPPRRVSGLACVLGGRTHTNLVGAHLCVRPCAKAACMQRADTQVGPYKGNKGVLCFGGVASIDCAQRSRQASTLQSYQTIRLPCRGAPVCAPVRESGMYAPGRHIGRPLQGLQTYFMFWWGCDCSVRAAGGACPAPTKAPDMSAIYVGNGLARSAARTKGASPGAPACLF